MLFDSRGGRHDNRNEHEHEHPQQSCREGSIHQMPGTHKPACFRSCPLHHPIDSNRSIGSAHGEQHHEPYRFGSCCVVLCCVVVAVGVVGLLVVYKYNTIHDRLLNSWTVPFIREVLILVGTLRAYTQTKMSSCSSLVALFFLQHPLYVTVIVIVIVVPGYGSSVSAVVAVSHKRDVVLFFPCCPALPCFSTTPTVCCGDCDCNCNCSSGFTVVR